MGFFGALSAIGNLGEQMGEADLTVRGVREREAAAASAAKAREDAIAQRKKQFEETQKLKMQKRPLGAPFVDGATGKTVQRMYDPATQGISVQELSGGTPETEAQKYKRSMIAIGMSEDEATKAAEAKYGPKVTPTKLSPEEQKRAFMKSLGWTDAQIDKSFEVQYGLKPRPRLASAASAGAPFTQQDVVELADEVRTGKRQLNDLRLLNKPLANAVNEYLVKAGTAPGHKETATELQAEDATHQLLPMVDNALKMLEKHKDETGAYSALKQHIAKGTYGAGISPGVDEEKILQSISFLQLLGVQPWTKTGRGKYIFEQIEPHLPKAGDALGLTYQKLHTLRELLPSLLTNPQGGGDDVDAKIISALNGGK